MQLQANFAFVEEDRSKLEGLSVADSAIWRKGARRSSSPYAPLVQIASKSYAQVSSFPSMGKKPNVPATQLQNVRNSLPAEATDLLPGMVSEAATMSRIRLILPATSYRQVLPRPVPKMRLRVISSARGSIRPPLARERQISRIALTLSGSKSQMPRPLELLERAARGPQPIELISTARPTARATHVPILAIRCAVPK